MIDMIGVGPFITIPLIISAMGGPQAMLGWILGAMFAMCDGLVWAELGAAMPGSGGSYRYLREIYGAAKTGPADVVSLYLAAHLQRSALDCVGRIGLARYATYILPGLEHPYADAHWTLHLPYWVALEIRWLISGARSWPSRCVCWPCSCCIARSPASDWMSKFLSVGVMVTIVWVIFAGRHPFRSRLAL